MEGQNMEQKMSFCCEDCNKSYSYRCNLIDHIRRIHPDKFKTFNSKRILVFKCITCGKDYLTKQKLKLHGSQAKHPAIDENSEVEKKIYNCKLCQYTATKSDLMNHIQSSHNIKIEKEILKFSTFKEFDAWKYNIEQITSSSFVTRYSYNCLNNKTTAFNCNRSGFYKCESAGKRHLKVQGSNKINAYCPAAIILKEKKEECEVEYTKTHFGHENNLTNVNLSRRDKEEIASKIAAKIPFRVIVDEIRGNTDITNVKKIDLLTHRDLYNIQKQYNLKSTAIRDKNDVAKVEALVKKVKDTGCVLLYKPQGVNKRHLSEDSYFPVAKKRTQNKIDDLMSRCATTSQLKVLDDALRPVQPKLDTLHAGLKQYIQIDKIAERRKIISQRKFYSTIKKKRPLAVEVVEPSQSNTIAIQLLHRTIQDPQPIAIVSNNLNVDQCCSETK